MHIFLKMCKRYFFILFVLKICTFRFANYKVDLLYGDGNKGPSQVSIGGQGGSDFCHMIFKNMALYMNKVFTKDECIKAYNYLQTLKSK